MAIYVPEKFYVGLRQPDTENPLGFMTPTFAEGFVKRKETVDKWSGSLKYNRDTRTYEEIEGFSKEVTNEPRNGFTMEGKQRRYSTSNVVWDVSHPEGFRFQISSENFEHLFSTLTIKKGKIDKELFFVRRANENFLTFANSEFSKGALLEKEAGKKVSLRDISIGDIVKLQTGEDCTYMGAVHLLQAKQSYSVHVVNGQPVPFDTEKKSIRRHIFKTDGGKRWKPYIEYASPTILSIVSKAKKPGKIEDTIEELKQNLLNEMDFRKQFSPSGGSVLAIETKPITLSKMKVELIPLPTSGRSNWNDGDTIICKRSDEEGIFIHRHRVTPDVPYRSNQLTDVISQEIPLQEGSILYTPSCICSVDNRYPYRGAVWRENRLPDTEDPSVITEVYRQWLVRP